MKSIHQFVKNKAGQLIGCVAATSKHNIGWSKCNFSKGDTFDKKQALKIALGRAAHSLVRTKIHQTVPASLANVYNHFAFDRAPKYFQSTLTSDV